MILLILTYIHVSILYISKIKRNSKNPYVLVSNIQVHISRFSQNDEKQYGNEATLTLFMHLIKKMLG